MEISTIPRQNRADERASAVYGQVQGMMDFVRDSAENGTSAHTVEEQLWFKLLQIGHESMGMFFEMSGTGDEGAEIECEDGGVLKRLENMHCRPYLCIYGHFELVRYVYGSREGQKIEYVPYDSRLQLPER